MTLEEFLEYVDEACEQAIETAASFKSEPIELTRSIDGIENLDRVVEICRNVYQKGYISEDTVWALSESFGILLGEMMINAEGWKWIMDDDGMPLVETPEGLKISPLTKINKIILSEEGDDGSPSGLYKGARFLLKYGSMSEEEKEKITINVEADKNADTENILSMCKEDPLLKDGGSVLVEKRTGETEETVRIIKEKKIE